MVDLDWKAKMVSTDMSNNSPKLSHKLQIFAPVSARAVQAEVSAASSSACLAYENYLRLNELRGLWRRRDFPGWRDEVIIKPALQALEMTFRLISTTLSDPRPYSNGREWKRRLESLTKNQIEIIAMLFEDGEVGEEGERICSPVPLSDFGFGTIYGRHGSLAEVWNMDGESPATVVNRTSEESLLPRLATWQTSEDVAQNIFYSLECEFRRCPYTLGLGEPNLAGKPTLEYDEVCRPSEVHRLKKGPYDQQLENNYENQTVYTTQQVLETWIHAAGELLRRATERIDSKSFKKAASDCYLIERIWKLLAEIEDLYLLMDPDDLLRLKNQLNLISMDDSEYLCFRSTRLVEITKLCKDLRHKVPDVLDVVVDPRGGPRIQEAAMTLYLEKSESEKSEKPESGMPEITEWEEPELEKPKWEKIHLLQALQAIESALKRFFYAYKQVLIVVMGSLEAKGNRIVVCPDSCDSLSQIFLEPTYFPSLDAAKTFLGNSLNQGHLGGFDRRTGHTQ